MLFYKPFYIRTNTYAFGSVKCINSCSYFTLLFYEIMENKNYNDDKKIIHDTNKLLFCYSSLEILPT